MSDDIKAIIADVKKFSETSFWLTPLNLLQERSKFLKDGSENPQFIYPELPLKEIKEYLEELNSLNLVKDDFWEFYVLSRKVEELKLKLKLILARGEERLSSISLKLFQCNFDKKTLEVAEKDAKIDQKFESKEKATSFETVETIKDYLNTYGIKDWTVQETNEEDFYVRVESSKKTILISKKINWDFSDLDNTLAHEIDGHVLRAVNSERQKVEVLQKPLPFYIKTEEGLASYLGDYFSTTAEISRKHHALKYLAGHLALKASFREVFKYLVDNGFTKDLAFQRTFRLKRGFTDTSVPGVYAREAMYYEGMIEVKNYLEKGGSLTKLYACKCGLEDLDQMIVPEDELVPTRLQKYL